MITNKIVPNIWFCVDGGNMLKVIEYYEKVFEKVMERSNIIQLGATPSGNTEMCEVRIFGQQY